MADEWSKPVKGRDGGWEAFDTREDGRHGHFRIARVTTADVVFSDDFDGEKTAPRDVVLRLLAAEASDRLGWVWETMVEGPGIEDAIQAKQALKWIDGTLFTRMNRFGVHLEWRSDGPGSFYCRTANDLLLTELDIVASLMGRFLLEDAMKEGA